MNATALSRSHRSLVAYFSLRLTVPSLGLLVMLAFAKPLPLDRMESLTQAEAGIAGIEQLEGADSARGSTCVTAAAMRFLLTVPAIGRHSGMNCSSGQM